MARMLLPSPASLLLLLLAGACLNNNSSNNVGLWHTRRRSGGGIQLATALNVHADLNFYGATISPPPSSSPPPHSPPPSSSPFSFYGLSGSTSYQPPLPPSPPSPPPSPPPPPPSPPPPPTSPPPPPPPPPPPAPPPPRFIAPIAFRPVFPYSLNKIGAVYPGVALFGADPNFNPLALTYITSDEGRIEGRPFNTLVQRYDLPYPDFGLYADEDSEIAFYLPLLTLNLRAAVEASPAQEATLREPYDVVLGRVPGTDENPVLFFADQKIDPVTNAVYEAKGAPLYPSQVPYYIHADVPLMFQNAKKNEVGDPSCCDRMCNEQGCRWYYDSFRYKMRLRANGQMITERGDGDWSRFSLHVRPRDDGPTTPTTPTTIEITEGDTYGPLRVPGTDVDHLCKLQNATVPPYMDQFGNELSPENWRFEYHCESPSPDVSTLILSLSPAHGILGAYEGFIPTWLTPAWNKDIRNGNVTDDDVPVWMKPGDSNLDVYLNTNASQLYPRAMSVYGSAMYYTPGVHPRSQQGAFNVTFQYVIVDRTGLYSEPGTIIFRVAPRLTESRFLRWPTVYFWRNGLAPSIAAYERARSVDVREEWEKLEDTGWLYELRMDNESSYTFPPEAGYEQVENLRGIWSTVKNTSAVNMMGLLYAYGDGAEGQLGRAEVPGNDHRLDDRPQPVKVLPPPSAEQDPSAVVSVSALEELELSGVSCGYAHALAVSAQGNAYAWGRSNNGALGAVYDPQYDMARHQEQEKASPPGSIRDDTMASKQERVEHGDRASRPVRPRAHPRLVESDIPRRIAFGTYEGASAGTGFYAIKKLHIVAVRAGWHHSAAIDNLGHVYMWGSDASGQLGRGKSRTSFVATRDRYLRNHTAAANAMTPFLPTRVQGDIAGEFVTDMALGMCHTLALTSKGELFSWGCNGDGQLGHARCVARELWEGRGTCQEFDMFRPLKETFVDEPKRIERMWHWASGRWSVFRRGAGRGYESTLVKARAIAAGATHSAFISVSGVVYTWGNGREGQLGHSVSVFASHAALGSVSSPETYLLPIPKPVARLEGINATYVSCGDAHTLVTTHGGRIWAFGANREGELGLGDDAARFVPRLVWALKEQNIVRADAGASSSGAVTDEGLAYFWGLNSFGQLGLSVLQAPALQREILLGERNASLSPPPPPPPFDLPEGFARYYAPPPPSPVSGESGVPLTRRRNMEMEKEGRRGRAAYDMDPDLDAIRRAFPMNAAAAARDAAAARAKEDHADAGRRRRRRGLLQVADNPLGLADDLTEEEKLRQVIFEDAYGIASARLALAEQTKALLATRAIAIEAMTTASLGYRFAAAREAQLHATYEGVAGVAGGDSPTRGLQLDTHPMRPRMVYQYSQQELQLPPLSLKRPPDPNAEEAIYLSTPKSYGPEESGFARPFIATRHVFPVLNPTLQQVVALAFGRRFGVAEQRVCRRGSRIDQATGHCVKCPPGHWSYEFSSVVCIPCKPGSANAQHGAKVCPACASGSFSDTYGATHCKLCPTGTASSVAGAATNLQCLPCGPGFHAPENGTASCEPCSPGTFSEGLGNFKCLKCPVGKFNAGYAATSVHECLDCKMGTYNNVEGKSACKECPHGQYTAEVGSVSCLGCAAGYFSNSSSSYACQPCPIGTYGTDGNLTSVEQCIPCGIGEFGDKTGATKCTLCEMGSFSNETGSTACTKCPAGTYGEERGSVDIASGCKPCPPGRHAPKPGTFLSLELDATLSAAEQAEAQLPCTRCSTGTYAEEPGTVECTSCRAGTHNNRTGSFRRRDCVECARGNFTHEPGMTNCLLCAPGSFTNYTGMSECTLSPPGTQIPMFGAWNYSLAEDCELGYYAPNPGSGFCLKCEPGFYQDETGAAECKPCERGYFLNATNGTSPFDCMPCPLGTFGKDVGLSECPLCGPGTFADELALLKCKECSAGFELPRFGGNTSSDCTPCPPGTATDQKGTGTCPQCLPGTYQPNIGQETCELCNAGTFLAGYGSFTSEDCVACPTDPVGTYGPEPGLSACLRCPRGRYADEEGLVECKPVSPGSFLPTTGSNTSLDALPCPIGTAMPQAGAARCSDCFVGKYASRLGQIECTSCPAGYYQPLIGATSSSQCLPCGPGYRSPAASESCILCAPGTYNTLYGQSECVLCPPGTANPIAGMKTLDMCVNCDVGRYQGLPGKAICLPCPRGSYGNRTRMTACDLCPVGKFVDAEASTNIEDCEPCPFGRFASTPGQEVCTACPSGTFADEMGNVGCKPCPYRTYGQEDAVQTPRRCLPCPRWTRINSTRTFLPMPFGFERGANDITECVYDHSGAPSNYALVLVFVVYFFAL